jgi:hypothetical protein
MLASIGGLAAASFFAVMEARRSANRLARQDEAAAAADDALFRLLGRLDATALDLLPVGSTDSGLAFVTRLTKGVYWITAVGRAAAGTSVEAGRVHNLLVEVLRPTVPSRAAIVSAGAVLAGSDVVMSGDDSPPPGWTDCPATDTTPAPAVHGSGDTATYQLLGRVTTAALAARADIAIAGGAILSPRPDIARECVPSAFDEDAANWGEPLRIGQSPGCERWLPVIHASGDLAVTSGRGQGILLVDGHLRIAGPFLFYGVIVAFGGIEASGPDVTVYGTVLSGSSGGVVWRAAGQVQRSTCAVRRSADAAAKPFVVTRRGWAELF